MTNRNIELEVVTFYDKNQPLIEGLHDAIADTEQANQHYSQLATKQDEVRDAIRKIGIQNIENTEISELYSSTKRETFEFSRVVDEANRKVAKKGTTLSIDAVKYFRKITTDGFVSIGDVIYDLGYDVLTVDLGRLTLALASGGPLNKVANQVYDDSNSTHEKRYAKVPVLDDWKRLSDSLRTASGSRS